MKLVSVEVLPKKRASRKQLQEFIEVFVNGDANISRVDFEEGEYASEKTCYSTLHKAVERSGHPVRVMMRAGSVYLVKH